MDNRGRKYWWRHCGKKYKSIYDCSQQFFFSVKPAADCSPYDMTLQKLWRRMPLRAQTTKGKKTHGTEKLLYLRQNWVEQMSLLNTVASLARSNTEAAKELLLRGSKSVTDNKRPFADSKIKLLGFVYMINLLSINWGLVQSVTGHSKATGLCSAHPQPSFGQAVYEMDRWMFCRIECLKLRPRMAPLQSLHVLSASSQSPNTWRLNCSCMSMTDASAL